MGLQRVPSNPGWSHPASYINFLVLNTECNMKSPIKFPQRLFSARTICPLPRPLASARWRPTATTPHRQALCRLRCRLPGIDYVLRRNLCSISPRGPHAVSGQRHLHRMGTPLIPQALLERTSNHPLGTRAQSHINLHDRGSKQRPVVQSVCNGCKLQFGSLKPAAAVFTTLQRETGSYKLQ